jgi:hypothetical protein
MVFSVTVSVNVHAVLLWGLELIQIYTIPIVAITGSPAEYGGEPVMLTDQLFPIARHGYWNMHGSQFATPQFTRTDRGWYTARQRGW